MNEEKDKTILLSFDSYSKAKHINYPFLINIP